MEKQEERKPVFVDNAFNPELTEILNTHLTFTTDVSCRNQIVNLINQTSKLFGTNITYVMLDTHSKNYMDMDIFQGGISENSPYLSHNRAKLFGIRGTAWPSEKISEFRVALTLQSSISDEVVTSHSSYEAGRIRGAVSIWAASSILRTYQKRLIRYNKKHNFKKADAITFVNALELYSGYARMKGHPLNVTNYVARAVLAGMPAEKAVWMVSTETATGLAETFKDIPVSWLNKI